MSAPACDRFDRLRRHLNRFMKDPRDGRNSIGELARRLGDHGEVAIVGGMLRDLLLKDNYAGFTSDVDLVIDAPDTSAVRAILSGYGGVRNRFGGYALGTKWSADVWFLDRTWAHVQGHKNLSKVDDLLGTTFFNWDAVLYSMSRKQVICTDSYLKSLDDRYLDINLVPNPNRIGSCVRTLRSAALWGAMVSPQLARVALRVIDEVGPSALLEAEARSYGHRRVLTSATIWDARRSFFAASAFGIACQPLSTSLRGLQRQLPLATEAAPKRQRSERGTVTFSTVAVLPERASKAAASDLVAA